MFQRVTIEFHSRIAAALLTGGGELAHRVTVRDGGLRDEWQLRCTIWPKTWQPHCDHHRRRVAHALPKLFKQQVRQAGISLDSFALFSRWVRSIGQAKKNDQMK